MGHAQVHQARFLAAGHDFDAVPQRGFGRHQEGLRRCELTHGIGGDRTHALRRNVLDALAEARKTLQRALAHGLVQAALAVQAFGHAHRFAQAVHHAQLAQHVACDHHVEAVGTQVQRGQQFAVFQRRRGGRVRLAQGVGAHDAGAGDVVHPQILASSACCAECGGVSPCGDSCT